MTKYEFALINRIEATRALVGGQISGPSDGSDTIYNDGQTPPTEAEIDAKLASMISDWDAQEYARNRQAEYPDWGTQLEKIADDGIDAWKADMLEPVKAKFPKP
jgi:hypothetical protein